MSDKIKKTIDKKPIKELAKLLDELNLTEISYSEGSFSISVSKAASTHNSIVSSSPLSIESDEKDSDDYRNDPRAIKSPMVGTAYLSPEPKANTFIKKGDKVNKGQTLLIIEAMKVMNNINAPKDGIIVDVLIEDSQPVEYDQPIITVSYTHLTLPTKA